MLCAFERVHYGKRWRVVTSDKHMSSYFETNILNSIYTEALGFCQEVHSELKCNFAT